MSGDETGALASGWHELAGDYELGRRKPDSFDRILNWPAELSVLGDVTGLDVLDVGCGSGAKSQQISLTHVTNTVADMINTFAAAGLWIEHALEPQLGEEHRRHIPPTRLARSASGHHRFPHQASYAVMW